MEREPLLQQSTYMTEEFGRDFNGLSVRRCFDTDFNGLSVRQNHPQLVRSQADEFGNDFKISREIGRSTWQILLRTTWQAACRRHAVNAAVIYFASIRPMNRWSMSMVVDTPQSPPIPYLALWTFSFSYTQSPLTAHLLTNTYHHAPPTRPSPP